MACLSLAGADTYTSALEWFSLPVIELQEWVDAVIEKQRRDNSKHKK